MELTLNTTALQEEQKPVGNGKELPVRYDGKLKVLGKAKYAAEFEKEIEATAPGKSMLYAYLIQSSIPSGEIISMDTTVADRASGVVKILTRSTHPSSPWSHRNRRPFANSLFCRTATCTTTTNPSAW